MRIGGNLAVVTGGGVGTGRAIAQRLGAVGARVVVADIDRAAAAETCASIGPLASYREVDLLDDQAVAELMACEPRILVNNAGGGAELRPCFPDAEPARWTAALGLNLRVPVLTTQLALEPMRQAGGGVVVNIGSTAGLGQGTHVSPEYCAAKAGLIRLTSTLAPLRDSHGVRVNCVVPDWVATDRGVREREALPPAERGPAQVPLETLTDAVATLIEDDELTGKVLVLPRAEPPYFLS